MNNYLTASPEEIIVGLRYIKAHGHAEKKWTAEIIEAAIHLIQTHAVPDYKDQALNQLHNRHQSTKYQYLALGDNHLATRLKGGLHDYEDHDLQLIAIELQRRDIASTIQHTGGGCHHLEIMQSNGNKAITIGNEFYGIDLQAIDEDEEHDFIYSLHLDKTCEAEGYRPNPIEYAEIIERGIALLK
ncbi:MAG: hypothetical protein EBY23_12640 [Actinobacteria bacterium]|nr:hypothetical protein [Actinomycetota bacterium]